MYPPTKVSADYLRGTVMEPDRVSPFRANFGEYERLGKTRDDISRRLDLLNEKMKVSRQSGAFQNLQMQMAEVKRLVKEREKIDAEMSTLDLARKKDDDYKIAAGYEASYSEHLENFEERVERLGELLEEFSEGEFDFTRCQKPDGSFYGTRGKCRKGTEAGAKVPSEEKAISSPVRQEKVKTQINKLKSEHEGAKLNLQAAKKALKEHKGRGVKARAQRQILQRDLYEAEMKFGSTRDKLVSAVVKARKAGILD